MDLQPIVLQVQLSCQIVRPRRITRSKYKEAELAKLETDQLTSSSMVHGRDIRSRT